MTTAPRPSREIDGKGRTIRFRADGRSRRFDPREREAKPSLHRS